MSSFDNKTKRILHILLLVLIIILAVNLGDERYALPYPTVSAIVKYIMIAVTLIGLLFICNKIRIGTSTQIIVICYIIRMIIEVVNLLGTREVLLDAEIKYIFTLFASVVVILIYSQAKTEEDNRWLVYTLYLSLVVIALQAIITFALTYQSMTVYWGLKDRLHLPIGSSNFVECWIIMLTSFVYYSDDKRSITKIALFLLGFIGALCTRSKVAILIWGIWFVYIFLKFYFKPSLKNVFVIALVITAVIYTYQLLESINFFEYSTSALMKLFSPDATSRRLAFNGRIELYRSAYESFVASIKSILIGNGRSYTVDSGIAHNYILDVLATGGVLGLLMVLIQYITVLRTLIKNIKSNVLSKAALVMLCFVFINSMYEPCLDDYCFNIIYWMIISLGFIAEYGEGDRGKSR